MMSVRVFVVNNYGQYCHLIFRTLRDLGAETKIVRNDLSVEELEAMEPDGIVLSGGPSLERSGRCEEYVKMMNVPILGICLGHQIIAKAYGGEVRRGKQGGYAEVIVEILEEDDIFRGLPKYIRTWASHSDEVAVLPENFEILARSEICEIEAMRHRDKDIFGIQWHPEVAHTERGEDVFRNFMRICRI
ncbi:MAG: GMP synthase subunit A [Archaeoglobi archaeon]|nr:GMP synthase subunit A [Candidatus Mnemosynella bozhongmuii]